MIWGVSAVLTEYCAFGLNELTYADWRYARDYLDGPERPRVDLLILGDSRAKAGIIPERIHPRARSFALPAGSVAETFYFARRYLEHNPAPRRVFLSISPQHWTASSSFWWRTVKWRFLDLGEYLEMLSNASRLPIDPFSWGPPGPPEPIWWYTRLIRSWLRMPFELNQLEFGSYFKNKPVLEERYRKNFETGGFGSFGLMKNFFNLNWESTQKSFRANPMLVDYFERLLALLKERGIPVVFEFVPINQASYAKLDPEFTRALKEFIDVVAARHPEAKMTSILKAYPDGDFGDVSHLNAEGAEKYSDSIRDTYFSDLEGATSRR